MPYSHMFSLAFSLKVGPQILDRTSFLFTSVRPSVCLAAEEAPFSRFFSRHAVAASGWLAICGRLRPQLHFTHGLTADAAKNFSN